MRGMLIHARPSYGPATTNTKTTRPIFSASGSSSSIDFDGMTLTERGKSSA